MDLSFINLIDQMIDAVGLVFYMLFWGGNKGWISVDKHLYMSLYDASWELRWKSYMGKQIKHSLFSTVTQPYIFLAIFPDIRREFFGYYSKVEATESRSSAVASVEQHCRWGLFTPFCLFYKGFEDLVKFVYTNSTFPVN